MAKDKPITRASWSKIDDRGVGTKTGQRGFYRPLPVEKGNNPMGVYVTKFRCEVMLSAQEIQHRDEEGRLQDLLIIEGFERIVKLVPRSSGNEPGTWNTIQTGDV